MERLDDGLTDVELAGIGESIGRRKNIKYAMSVAGCTVISYPALFMSA